MSVTTTRGALTMRGARSGGADRAAHGAPDLMLPSVPTHTEIDALPPQQRAVLDLLAIGAGPKDIARALHLSRNTVKRYIHIILVKTGCESVPEAIALYYGATPYSWRLVRQPAV